MRERSEIILFLTLLQGKRGKERVRPKNIQYTGCPAAAYNQVEGDSMGK